jgi:hypothetical protein
MRRKAYEKPFERKTREKTEAILSAEGPLETGPVRRSNSASSESDWPCRIPRNRMMSARGCTV